MRGMFNTASTRCFSRSGRFPLNGLLFAEQLGFLVLILGIRDDSGILGLLQVNQLLPDGGTNGFAGRAAADLQVQTAGEQCHGGKTNQNEDG